MIFLYSALHFEDARSLKAGRERERGWRESSEKLVTDDLERNYSGGGIFRWGKYKCIYIFVGTG